MLELKDCTFEYPSKKIFEGLTINFKANAINGVLGRNGIGKTTLFKILTNVLKVGKGQIQLHGAPLNPTDVSILQTAPFFYPYMKGEEYLKLVLGTLSERAADLAAVFNLPLDELIDNYSCLLYTSPSPRDAHESRMPSSA